MKTLILRISSFFVISLLVALMLFYCAACKLSSLFDPKPELEKENHAFPSAKGKLTVRGLDGFNDKYVCIQYSAGDIPLVGITDISGYPSNITYQLAQISNGKIKVPLYYKNASAKSYSDSFIAYDDNDTLSLSNQLLIVILNDGSLKPSDMLNTLSINLGIKYISSGLFSGGNMVLDWETCDINYDDFIFESNIGAAFYSIAGYTGTGGDLVLPALYSNKPVLAIGNRAFKNKNIISVIIHDNIISIAEDSFILNPDLASITIGSKVAFYSDVDNIKISFDHDFDAFYRKSNKTKGIYTKTAGAYSWTKK